MGPHGTTAFDRVRERDARVPPAMPVTTEPRDEADTPMGGNDSSSRVRGKFPTEYALLRASKRALLDIVEDEGGSIDLLDDVIPVVGRLAVAQAGRRGADPP